MTARTNEHGSAPTTSLPIGEIDADLARHEAARVEQLAALDPDDHDLVARAHRESVVRILEDIRTARRRVAEGRYGRCVRCDLAIAAERLEALPWTTTCVSCADLRRF